MQGVLTSLVLLLFVDALAFLFVNNSVETGSLEVAREDASMELMSTV